MATIELTTSSQLKSANAESEIANHSGKKNRKIYAHENKDIDLQRSDWNVEFDFLSRDELLEEQYGERIAKHNASNRGAKRWDMKKFLKTIQGKTVYAKGIDTGNKTWETLCQITYVGDKEAMGRDGKIWTALMEGGVPEAKIRASYSKGYEDYVKRHNETFKTLPIYHSDIHFDETTPHGHDAIVVMAKTQGGRASSTLNNALAEHYDNYDAAKSVPGRKANLKQYREDNDKIAFSSISGALKELADEYNVDLSFELIRTGQDFSLDLPNYKKAQDSMAESKAELSEREAKLEERINEAAEKESALAQQEADLNAMKARMKKEKEELDEKNKNLSKMLSNEFSTGVKHTLRLVDYMHNSSVKGALKVVDESLVSSYALRLLPLENPTEDKLFEVAKPLLNAKVAQLNKKQVTPPPPPPTHEDGGPEL